MRLLLVVLLLAPACAGDMPPGRQDKGVVIVDSGDSDGPVPVPDQGSGLPEGSVPTPDLPSGPTPDVTPWPTPDSWSGTDDIGKPCTSNADCTHNICATNTHTGVKFCTKTCDPCTPNPCPSGSGCQNAGIAYICAPGYPNAPCQP